MMSKKQTIHLQYLFYLFLLFTLFFPVEYTKIKIIFLLILIIGKINLRIPINKQIGISLCLVVYNIISILIGIIYNAPGALRIITTDVIYPVMFPLLFYWYCNKENFHIISKILLLAGSIISIYDICLVLSSMKLIVFPSFLYFEPVHYSFGFYGYTQFSTSHLNILFFTFPFSISLFLYCNINRRNYPNIVHQKYILLAIIIQLICIILATRSALLIIAVISPLIYGLIQICVNKKINTIYNKRIVILGIVLVLIIMIIIFKEYLVKIAVDIIHKVVEESGKYSTSIRAVQSKELLKGWIEKPLFGHGAGSYVESCIRDPNMPWAYEKTYYALLFQKGIIGFVIYFGFYFSIIYIIICKIRNKIEYNTEGIAYIVGFISFLIANSSNPYLGKFGFMWVLYLPFVFGMRL